MARDSIRETLVSIARRRGCSTWAVERAIARAGVAPVERFGTTRTYDTRSTRAIDAELDRVAAVRGKRETAGVA